ncbi:MAG TPA: precorrin-2 C(20)-methyltransferase [Planctomycetaceae bacterium]|nr:precorrin-2 C(20)-methyltransferase [Planctomycetaceae bacterium]
MIRGKFYGIGVGPGDPELLTFKAVRTIRSCDVIAVPEPDDSERTALHIVGEYLHGKELLKCRFSMSRDEKKRIAQRRHVGEQICSVLETGKSVGFVTLGDPSIYSTYTYIRDIVRDHGFEVETVPGIASFSAAAAVLNVSLCEGKESLHLLPAGCEEDIERWIGLSGTKVVMKSGKNLDRVLKTLQEYGLSKQTRIVSRCTMEGERIFHSIDEFDKVEQHSMPGYFSVLIVKEKRQ